jgi:hypothetical protein
MLATLSSESSILLILTKSKKIIPNRPVLIQDSDFKFCFVCK